MVIHQVRSLALTLALLRSAHSAAACLREHLWAHARPVDERRLRRARGDSAAGCSAGWNERTRELESVLWRLRCGGGLILHFVIFLLFVTIDFKFHGSSCR